MTAPAKAAPMREDVTRTERLKLTDREQMLDAQSLCLPCKLCGGSAVITDAGPGAGYYIKCENSLSFRSHKGCLIDERRVSGWAYNVADWWNRLAHTARPDAGDEDVERVYRQGFRDARYFFDPSVGIRESTPEEEDHVARFAAMREGVDRGMVEVTEANVDWRRIAILAGDYGIRYRTNAALVQFLNAALSPEQPR